MRRDMKDILVTRGRYGKETNKRHNRIANQDPDTFPLKESMRNGRRVNLNDLLAPLRRFLEKNVGRKWDKVYADICRYADGRSVLGNHLRDHARNYVRVNSILLQGGKVYSTSFYYRELYDEELYVDGQGILRKYSRKEKKYKSPEKHYKKSKPLVRKPDHDQFDITLKERKAESKCDRRSHRIYGTIFT